MKNNKDLQKELEELGYPNGKQLSYKLREKIKERTSFLDSMTRHPMGLRIFCIMNEYHSIPKCHECDNQVKAFVQDKKCGYPYVRFAMFCSPKCSNKSTKTKEKKKQTSINRYGVDNPNKSEEVKEKRKKTMLERHGVEHSAQMDTYIEKRRETCLQKFGHTTNMLSDETKNKLKESMREKYGVDNPSHSQEIRDKIKKTNNEKYGKDYFFQTEQFKEQYKQTSLNRYGVEHPMYVTSVKEKVKKTNTERYGYDNYRFSTLPENVKQLFSDKEELEKRYKQNGFIVGLSKELGVSQNAVTRALIRNGIDIIKPKYSLKEKELHNLIEQAGVDYDTNIRGVIPNLELDIYIPSHKLAIEFNGIYWHSDLFKDKNYHQEKSLKCHENGIEIIHVWEDDWDDQEKREIIKKRILHKLGLNKSERVYARKCSVVSVHPMDVQTFMNSYHIQGYISATEHLGLEYDGTLVAVMSFKRVGESWDLSRFATSCSVVGGMSKLLKRFVKLFKPNSIFTFASIDYSSGNVYSQCGFDKHSVTPPNYWYVKGNDRFSRQKFMKHKLKDKLEVFDPSLTEKENMENHGFIRLYDCGSIRYEMNFSPTDK